MHDACCYFATLTLTLTLISDTDTTYLLLTVHLLRSNLDLLSLREPIPNNGRIHSDNLLQFDR